MLILIIIGKNPTIANGNTLLNAAISSNIGPNHRQEHHVDDEALFCFQIRIARPLLFDYSIILVHENSANAKEKALRIVKNTSTY